MDHFTPPDDEWSGDLDTSGRTVAILGVMSLVCAMIGPCSCYTGYFLALILGIVAQIQSRSLLVNENLTGEGLAYANVGKWTSVIAILFSALIGLFILLYCCFYVLFLASLASLGP